MTSENTSINCSSSKRQKVDERLHKNNEEIPVSTTFTAAIKEEETEEINDVIPSWLINHDEEEHKEEDSMHNEISIEIDGEIEVEHTRYMLKPAK